MFWNPLTPPCRTGQKYSEAHVWFICWIFLVSDDMGGWKDKTQCLTTMGKKKQTKKTIMPPVTGVCNSPVTPKCRADIFFFTNKRNPIFSDFFFFGLLTTEQHSVAVFWCAFLASVQTQSVTRFEHVTELQLYWMCLCFSSLTFLSNGFCSI